jgi:hypothetical protein
MSKTSITGIFIGGPHACATVYDMAHVEVVIKALCEVTGDDQDDYTATDLDNPQAFKFDFKAFLDPVWVKANETFKEADKAFKAAEKALDDAFDSAFAWKSHDD